MLKMGVDRCASGLVVIVLARRLFGDVGWEGQPAASTNAASRERWFHINRPRTSYRPCSPQQGGLEWYHWGVLVVAHVNPVRGSVVCTADLLMC